MTSESRFLNTFCVFALAALGGFVCAKAAKAQNTDATAVGIHGIEVEECVVQFADEVDVPALESGRVAEMHVKANQMIGAGAPVLRLGDQSLLIRRKAAQMRMTSAQKAADATFELDFAQSALKEASEELEINLKINADKGGTITRDRIRQLRIAAKRATLEVARARQQIEQAQVEVSLQQSEIAVLDDQLRRLHADSPLDGVVLDLRKSAGEWVEKGQTVATVARIDRLHVHAFMPSERISPMSCVGLQVSVDWPEPRTGIRRSLQGQIVSVDPQRLPGSRFRIHAEIINQPEPKDNRHWQLNPGADVRMIVQAGSIASGNPKNSINR
jgi:multidrug efflux pump subunit AcrA (membrane-fusion protein)